MSELKIFNKKVNVSNKRVILRLDLNVPIKNNKIDDHTRILAVEPLIKTLVQLKAKIIIISHLGRPKGKKNKSLSLKIVYDYLKKKIDTKISFYEKTLDKAAIIASKNIKQGDILFFENIRFFREEETDDENFSKKLALLGDIFINEAFSCSHRKQASIHKITKFINSYGGPLLKKEYDAIDQITKKGKKPITCIIGGSKITTKIKVLVNLIKKSNNLVIIGAMANNFLKYKGFNIGSSLVEKNSEKFVEEIYKEAKKNSCNICVPVDCFCAKTFDGKAVYKSLNDLNSNEMILDIGKKTINLIKNIIGSSQTIFWNGPAGYYENAEFSKGTVEISDEIAKKTENNSIMSIVGGGDTIAAIKKTSNLKTFSHLSTAGGAFLESLEGKDLPGIKVLKN